MKTYQFNEKGSEIQELLNQVKNKTLYSNATTENAGLMSAEDKSTLNTLYDNVGENIQQINELNNTVSQNSTAIEANAGNIATNTSDISTLNTTTGGLATRLSAAEDTLANIFQLDANNFMGIYANTQALEEIQMTGAGWALVGEDLTELYAYVWNIPQGGWEKYGETTYDYSDYSGLATQVTQIGSKIGDLSQLETTVKTDLVSAINEVKEATEGISSSAADTTYVDNYGIGADNVQEAIDNSVILGDENITVDFSQYEEQRVWINGSKWSISTKYGIFVPVKYGQRYKITGNAVNASTYAFLVNNVPGGASATVKNFAYGASTVVLGVGQSIIDTAPIDAAYMWVGTSNSASDGVYAPQMIEEYNKELLKDSLAELEERTSNISERVGRIEAGLKSDQSEYIGNWRTSNSSLSPIVVGDDGSVTITCGTNGRVGFEVSNIGDGKILHVSHHFEKATKKSPNWGIGNTLTASWANINAVSGSATISEALRGDVEFSFVVPSGIQFIYVSAPAFRDGSETTVVLSNLKVWTEDTLSDKFEALETEQRIPSILTQYEYYGEKINLPSAHHVGYINYMTLSCSRMSANYYQGAACYGDYLFVGGANGYELDIYNLSEKTFVEHIEIIGKESNENDHMNTLFFSHEFHTSGDLFPLLYSCTGYVQGDDGCSYLHGYRIVKSESEETFTAELVHTIALDFDTWTEAVCNREGGYLWIRTGNMTLYKYKMPSYTNGNVTLSPNTNVLESFSIPSPEYATASVQGFVYHQDHIYHPAGNGSQVPIRIVSINVRTRCRATNIDLRAMGLTQEPESCVIYNGHLCIVYNTKLVMFYFD